MSEFDAKARQWDSDKMHMDRSLAIAEELKKLIPAGKKPTALEFGAGTGILSFLLKDHFSEIVLLDSSKEMLKVCEEKIAFYGTDHIKTEWFDLAHDNYKGTFDFIYTQMVLHHVKDTNEILKKFHSLLNPGGQLIIADLYPEDGSFHGQGVDVHLGFDPGSLIETIKKTGFKFADHHQCFVIKRPDGNEFPVFFLRALK